MSSLTRDAAIDLAMRWDDFVKPAREPKHRRDWTAATAKADVIFWRPLTAQKGRHCAVEL